MARVQAAQRRKAMRWAIEQSNGLRVEAQAIKASKDGGLLIHVKAEAGK
jgi:hypothetical protein